MFTSWFRVEALRSFSSSPRVSPTRLLTVAAALAGLGATSCVGSSTVYGGTLEADWTIDGAVLSCGYLGDDPSVTGLPDHRGAWIYFQVDDFAEQGIDCRSYSATSIPVSYGQHSWRAYIADAQGLPITTTTAWFQVFVHSGEHVSLPLDFTSDTLCRDASPLRAQLPGQGQCIGFAQ